MRILICLLLVFSVSACTTAKKGYKQKLSIVQGLTTDRFSQFTVLASTHEELLFFYKSGLDELKKIENITTVSRAHNQSWGLYKFTITGLEPNKDYQLIVKNLQGDTVDERLFSALNLKKEKATIAVASCMADATVFASVRDQIWPELLAHKPDLLFLIGDNVYADMWIGGKLFPEKVTPEHIWDRYIQTRNSLPVFRARKLVPIIATWDDHDYGVNNGDKDFKFKAQTTQIFTAFWAQKDVGVGPFVAGPGVSSYFEAFGQGFIFTDNRSFRTAKGTEPAKQTHWGQEQEKWILDKVNKGRQPKWLINGDQVWGAYHKFDSYEGHNPTSFKKMMKQLGHSKNPVWFLTGDRHLAELSEISQRDFPYTTYELTTSGIHAKTYPSDWARTPNFRQIEGAAEKYNYAIIETQANKNDLKLNVEVFGLDREKLFSRSLHIHK